MLSRAILHLVPIFLLSPALLQSAEQAAAPQTVASASRPASQPGDTVLVRFGNEATITQEDFEKVMIGFPQAQFEVRKDPVMYGLVQDKLVLLYAQDHPDLVPPAVLEAEIQRNMQAAGVTTREQFLERLAMAGRDERRHRNLKLVQLALARAFNRANEEAKDPARLRALWDEEPAGFDGTRVAARHIMIRVVPYHTPEERQARKAKAQKILDDLNAGRRTWEECVKESEDPSTLQRGGSFGTFPRHAEILESLSKLAFSMMVGERSGVVETEIGYHVLEVTDRIPGTRTFQHDDAQRELRLWIEHGTFQKILSESRKAHPVVGVRAPTLFAYPAIPEWANRPLPTGFQLPATRPATGPAGRGGAATRPSATSPARNVPRPVARPMTRPAGVRPSVTRPPATRPAPRR